MMDDPQFVEQQTNDIISDGKLMLIKVFAISSGLMVLKVEKLHHGEYETSSTSSVNSILCLCANYHVCQNKRALRETQIKISDVEFEGDRNQTLVEWYSTEFIVCINSKVTKIYFVLFRQQTTYY